MGLKYQIPTFLQRLYRGVVWRMDPSSKAVYLTFDDGPVPEVTPYILDILKAEEVKATFFMVAENADRYPEFKARVLEEGHRIGNHTYNHLTGTKVSYNEYLTNIAKADKVLDGTRLFRPPHGWLTCRQQRALHQQGYTIFLWDVLTHDWDRAYPAERIIEIVRRYTRNGSIINCHDSIKSKQQTLRALPEIIHYLKNEGYAFYTL